MILDVPLVRQAKNSNDCGIAAVCMILSYYNIKSSIFALKKQIKVDDFGTYAPQLGTFLIKQGFDVEIISLNPRLFTRNDSRKDSTQLKDHFNELLKKSKNHRDRKVLKHFIQFLNVGGKLTPKIPIILDVIPEIKKKRPIMALLTTNFLLGYEPKLNFHFNVITGFDNKKVYVNDPLPGKRGGKHSYPITDFFFGIYASSNFDFDNGSLIKIKRL